MTGFSGLKIGNLLAGLTMALHHHDIMEKLDEQADLALTNYGPVHPHYLAVLLKDFARLGFTPTRLLRNPTFLEGEPKRFSGVERQIAQNLHIIEVLDLCKEICLLSKSYGKFEAASMA